MIELFDRQFRRTAVLEHAYSIREEQTINSVNYLTFTLPDIDPKNELCQPFHFVRYADGDLYRIMAPTQTLTEEGHYEYRAEHVFAMLIDDLLEHDVQRGGAGMSTADVIREVLAFQHTPNWRLGECDFQHQFEYGWTDESVLAALHSIPNRFVEPYIWTFDTNVHPFVLNLKRLDMDKHPEMYIRAGKNALQVVKSEDATTVVTRLYPRGDGEGINTLTICDANGGVPYIESPPEIIGKYGIVRRAWRDKRYTNAQSLLEAGQAMLHELQTPFEQYEVDFAVLGEDDFHTPAIGKVVEIVGFQKTVITKIVWDHDEVTKSSLSIANKPQDIAGALSDLANRQRIEATYAQGATQIYADSVVDNADANTPVELRFFIPNEMAILNTVNLRVRISRFRAYSRATQGGGGSTETSARNPDGEYRSSEIAMLPQHIQIPEDERTNPNYRGAFHNHGINHSSHPDPRRIMAFSTEGQGLPLGASLERRHVWWFHLEESGAHIHPAHGHQTRIWGHTHTISLPNHEHQISPVIEHFGNAQQFRLVVNGADRGLYTTTDTEVNLVPYLLDGKGRIERGRWHTVAVRPNDVARVEMSYYVQGFIRSEGTRAIT